MKFRLDAAKTYIAVSFEFLTLIKKQKASLFKLKAKMTTAKQSKVIMNDIHIDVIKRFGAVYNLPDNKVMSHIAGLLNSIIENQLEGGKLLLEKNGEYRRILIGK